MGLEGANLCCPGGDETPDPLQVHVDGLSVCYLLGPTQLQNHLQQHMARAQGQTDGAAPERVTSTDLAPRLFI